MELETLYFKTESSQLKTAIDMVDQLAKALGNLSIAQAKETKTAIDAAKVKEAEAKAAKAIAEATIKETQAKEAGEKASRSKSKTDKESTDEVDKQNKVLERNTLILSFMRDGFSKGQSAQLAYAKMTGALTEELQSLEKVLLNQRKLMSGDPFDKSMSGLVALQNQYGELKEAIYQYNAGTELSRNQTRELARDKERIIEKFKQEGKSAIDAKLAIADYEKQYISLSSEVNGMIKVERDIERAHRDSMNAVRNLTKEEERMTSVVANLSAAQNNGAALSEKAAVSIANYERNLRLAGIAGKEAADKLALYRKQQELIVLSEQKRQEQYLTRAIIPQFSDIFVGLTTGQSPLTIMLQQLPQIQDLFTLTGVKAQDTVKVISSAATEMFSRLKDTVLAVGSALASVASNVIDRFVGGISNGIMSIVTLGKTADEIKPKMEAVFGAKFTDNFSKLLGALRLATTAFVSFGVALAGPVLVALYQQDKVLGELNRTLISTAANLGLTSGQMAEMAKSMNIAGTSSTKILSVFNQLATTGKITASALQEATQAAIELERAGGRSAEETGKLLAKVYDDPVKSLREYQIATGLVSEAEVEHINTLVKTEGQIEAVTEAQKLLATATTREAGRMITEMTPIERLWFNIKTQIGDAWKEIVNLATSVPVVGALSLAFKGVALVVTTLYTGIKQIGEALGGMAAIASAAFSDIANKDISFTRTKAMLTSVGEQNKKTTDQWKDSVNKILELDEYSVDNMKKKAEAAAKEAQANSEAGRKRVINEETLKDLKKYQEKQLTETLTKEQYVNKMYNDRLGKMKLLTEEQQKQFKEMFANEWEDAQKKPKKTEGDKEAERLRKAFIKDQKTVNSLLADSNGYQENYNKAQQKAVEIMSGPDFPKYTQEKRMQLAVDLERAIAEEQAVERQKLLNSLMGQASGLGADYYDKLRQLERAYRNQEVSVEVFELARKKLYETTEQGKQYVSFMNELIKKTEELAIARAKLEGERTATLIGGTEGEYLKEQLAYQEKLAKAQKDYNAEQAKVNEFYISKSKAPADEEMRIAAMKELKSVFDSTVANINFDMQTASLGKFTEQFKILIQAVESLGSSLTNVFGDFGTKLGSTLNSFANLAAGMDQNARQIQAAMQSVADAKQKVIESSSYEELIKNTKKQTDAENVLAKTQKKSALSEITMYANLAGAAKSMFGEKTAAAKAFGAIEKVLHIARIGMMLVEVAQTIASVGPTVAANAAKTTSTMGSMVVDGAAAVVKTLASLPFPANVAAGAAVAALVAGIIGSVGGSFNGGSGSSSAAPVNEGTGTVFGDSSAKSESFAQAEEYLAEANLLTQKYTPQMLVHLRNIDAQIAGLVNLIIRTGDVQNATSSLGIKTGTTYSAVGQIADKITAPLRDFVTKWLPVVGAGDDKLVRALIGGIFGKVSTSVTGQGLTGEKQSLGNIMTNQFQGQYYTDVQVRKKSWFSSSTKNQTYLTEAGAELEQQITAVFKGIYDSVLVATESLGQSQSAIRDVLDSFEVDIGRVSLQGTGAEIQERLSAVFGAAADSIAKAAMPGLEQFQDVGEGYFATLIRVATELDTVNGMFDMLGNTLFTLGISGVEASQSLIGLFGGLSELQSSFSEYYDTFYTQEEKIRKTTEQLTKVFSNLGLTLPDSIEGYRDIVNAQDLTTQSGQETFYTLLNLSSAFNEVIKYADEAANAAIEAAAAQAEATQKILDGLMKATDTALSNLKNTINSNIKELEKASAVTDAIFKALQDRISIEKKALEDQKAVTTKAIQDIKSIIDFLGESINNLRTQVQQTNEMLVRDAKVALNSALSGGVISGDVLKSAVGTLTESVTSTSYGSKVDQQRAYLLLSNDLEKLKGVNEVQMSVEERTLASIDASIVSLDLMLQSAQKQLDQLRNVVTYTGDTRDLLLQLKRAIVDERYADAQIEILKAQLLTAENQYNELRNITTGLQSLSKSLSEFAKALAAEATATVPIPEKQIRAEGKIGMVGSGGAVPTTLSPDESTAARFIGMVGSIPAFADGANLLNSDMIAQVHKGEAIIPAKFNPWNGGLLSADNSELINEVRALRNEVVLLRSEAQATAIHTSRTAKILDRNTEQDAFKTKVVA